MPSEASIASLLERVRSAEGADREIDEELAAVATGTVLERQPDGRAAYHKDNFWTSVQVEPVTASLDAALALVERASKAEPLDLLYEALEELSQRGWDPNIPRGPQIARALVAELLSSMQEEGEGNG